MVNADVQSQLRELQKSYATSLPDKMTEIREALAVFHGSGNQNDLMTVRNLSHKLAGSGATFGFPGLSTASRFMERHSASALEDEDYDTAVLSSELESLLAGMEKAAQQGSMGIFDEEVHETRNVTTSRRVILVDDDPDQASQLSLELSNFGFDLTALSHPDQLPDELERDGCGAVIMDMTIGDDPDGGANAVALYRDEGILKCPVIMLTARTDLAARLASVRAGIDAFLTKPVDMADLVDALDHLTSVEDQDPYRILVVDDDLDVIKFSKAVLEGAGMRVSAINDPMQILDALSDFGPELILLDLYMPGCSGEELAAVIRQQEAYAGIPIVFLSGESDKDKQLRVLELGGDDFLTKPIRSEHLVSSVRHRVSRFRDLRGLMVRDSMTGLFNHTTTKQFMASELARADRAKTTLTVASLDIDHFKNVNDSYGHGVGDRVIKSLARLLKQRLRTADIVGRMGGEEFAAVLPDSTAEQAEKVFNTIRQAFADIVFHTDIEDFNVTISCGIAEYPRYGSVSALSDASDKALYVAKNGGRNKVVLAD